MCFSAPFMHCEVTHLKVEAMSNLEPFEQGLVFAYNEMSKKS